MKIILFFNPFKIDIERIKKTIYPIFKKYNIQILKILSAGSGIKENIAEDADYYVVLGGDGTVLRIAEMAAMNQKPIIGINLGNLGFLNAFSQDQVEKAARDIVNKKLRFSDRLAINCSISGKKYTALNDIVVQKSQPLGTIDLEVKIENHTVYSFLGDGVIVSSPTGSTGYSLSAGGPIIHPSLEVIELIPLAPHALNIRPIIVPTQKNININIRTIASGFAYVTGDGDIIHRLESGMSLTINGADKKIKLAEQCDDDYFTLLNSKLAFGRRFE
ncbi:MAG: NAD(+)/NADH kinase [Thermotogota bacterium]